MFLLGIKFYNDDILIPSFVSPIEIYAWFCGISHRVLFPKVCDVNPSYEHTHIYTPFPQLWASLVAQTVKNLPAMQETQVRSLGQENPLEEGMATCSDVLAWRIPWTEEPGGLQSMGLQRVNFARLKRLSMHACLVCSPRVLYPALQI